MTHTLVIAKRELTSFFYSPVAYLVLGLFGFATSWIFAGTFSPGAPAAMRDTFFMVVWLMIFLVPAISMRLISDEIRNGTIESLMTSPVNDAQVILGKWLGAMAFLVVLLTPLFIDVIILAFTAQPDWGPILTGLVGLLLVGGLYLAIGTFASAATASQIIALVTTIFIIILLTFVMYFLPQYAWVWDSLRPVIYHLNVNEQFATFNKGLIDWIAVVYFVSGIALFLFLATMLLQSKRWR
ncbi:MAG: ABC transporter permease [Phycisphaeraceae bacterium]